MGKIAASVAGAVLGFGIAASALAQAPAEAWPARPVRIIVPYAPGGATDITARHFANRLNEVTGQPVVVDNRAGASGIIAIELAAKATPDGYTLLVGNVSTNAINETTFASQMKVKPSRALTGVSNLIELPHLFVASNAVAANTMRDFVAWAKSQPAGKISFGSSGVGSYPHLDGVRLARAAGFDAVHIPYKGGAAQMLPGIAGNEVQYMEINLASGLPFVQAGRMKAIAAVGNQRLQQLPNVPTMSESGYPGIGTNAWNGMFAPAGVPKAVLAQIHARVQAIMDAPQMKDTLAKSFMTVVVDKSPADFDKFVRAEVDKWGKVVRENNIKVE
ncbi:MAG: tripartite tricarboxylate transporter substrate binding protein [Burkholderiales bacterium]|nr:tripartite tricarboxylate transporter substrate binding protein [Burkholderiales bacterium]